MVSPVQVILNPENFEEARETGGGGPNKEFFPGRDKDFLGHKRHLLRQISKISRALSNQSDTDIGYLKVVLRREAWAKSHRPFRSLFKLDLVPVVGGIDLGEMLFEVNPEVLSLVAREVKQSEETTTWKLNKRTGKLFPNPSRRRSETGAIERIEIYGPDDRRAFTLEQAISWLSNPVTGGSYQIELFDAPPPRNTLDALDDRHRNLFASFLDGLGRIGNGLTVQRLVTRERSQPRLQMRLSTSVEPPTILLQPVKGERRRSLSRFDASEKRHGMLLSFLEKHPLVRRIELPGVLIRSARQGRVRPGMPLLPGRNTAKVYPKVGVIDGGIDDVLGDWIVDRWNILAEDDADSAHGTFIGGLLIAASSLNGNEVCSEPDGADLVDIAVFPSEDDPGAFANYYPGGLPEFFDEVEFAVAEARSRHGVRFFNMSLNVRQPASTDVYSAHAARIDQIAEDHDAIIFVSAGNLDSNNKRPEWPDDEAQALANLAAARDDRMLMPSESIRNVSVAAVNPPDTAPSICRAPACYSRRGPGIRAGVKPDFAHVGGSGSPHDPLGHGLFSLAPGNTVVDGCGTSYATPMVAKTASVLDSMIEGDVSRETLLALMVHHAETPTVLRARSISILARHLVGHGVPVSSSSMLENDDHQITLVVASRIREGQQVNFRFAWPASLVTAEGKCRGRAKLTLVSTPPIDPRFGSEFVRVNVEASLQQEDPKKGINGGWIGRLDPVYLPEKADHPTIEAELIEHNLKWAPAKIFAKTMSRGVGRSSNWRVLVSYLTRAGEAMPENGVPFTAVLTIEDPRKESPVFNDMRQTLNAIGVQLSDIRTAARITTRV